MHTGLLQSVPLDSLQSDGFLTGSALIAKETLCSVAIPPFFPHVVPGQIRGVHSVLVSA